MALATLKPTTRWPCFSLSFSAQRLLKSIKPLIILIPRSVSPRLSIASCVAVKPLLNRSNWAQHGQSVWPEVRSFSPRLEVSALTRSTILVNESSSYFVSPVRICIAGSLLEEFILLLYIWQSRDILLIGLGGSGDHCRCLGDQMYKLWGGLWPASPVLPLFPYSCFFFSNARPRSIPFAKRPIPNNSTTTHYDSIKLC